MFLQNATVGYRVKEAFEKQGREEKNAQIGSVEVPQEAFMAVLKIN